MFELGFEFIVRGSRVRIFQLLIRVVFGNSRLFSFQEILALDLIVAHSRCFVPHVMEAMGVGEGSH